MGNRTFRYEACGLVEYASNGEEVFSTTTKSKPKMWQIRLMNRVEKGYVGASFQCPICKEHYKMGYGVFGHIPLDKDYHEVTYWCRDCARVLAQWFHKR